MDLESKHIAQYYPYRLNYEYSLSDNKSEVFELDDWGLISFASSGYRYKPILRPLSDLIATIEHNDRQFIPLIELFNLIDDECHIDYNGNFDNPVLQIDDNWNHCLTFESNDQTLCFSYGLDSFVLNIDGNWDIVTPQLELFQKLLEWHFDVFNLIDNGLAKIKPAKEEEL